MSTRSLMTISMLVLSPCATAMHHLKTLGRLNAMVNQRVGLNHVRKISTHHEFLGVPDSSSLHGPWRPDTTVWDAVHQGDARLVRFFLDAGIDQNAYRNVRFTDRQNKSRTLLGQALRLGREWGGRDVFVPSKVTGHVNVIRLLLLRGANPNTHDSGLHKDGLTPLELTNDGRIMDLLLEFGAYPLAADETTGKTLLHTHEIVAPLLRSIHANGDSVDEKDKEDNTPLHQCAQKNDLERAQAFYEYGANPYAKNKEGKTPQDCAEGKGAKAFFRLMEQGEIARPALPWREKYLAMGECIAKLNRDISLISKADAQLCYPSGTSLLHQAVRGNWYTVVKHLIAQKADVNIKDGNGLTPLHWAVYRDNPVIFAALLAAGAQVKDDSTLHHIAVSCATPQIMQMIMNASE